MENLSYNQVVHAMQKGEKIFFRNNAKIGNCHSILVIAYGNKKEGQAFNCPATPLPFEIPVDAEDLRKSKDFRLSLQSGALSTVSKDEHDDLMDDEDMQASLNQALNEADVYRLGKIRKGEADKARAALSEIERQASADKEEERKKILEALDPRLVKLLDHLDVNGQLNIGDVPVASPEELENPRFKGLESRMQNMEAQEVQDELVRMYGTLREKELGVVANQHGWPEKSREWAQRMLSKRAVRKAKDKAKDKAKQQ